MPPSEKIAAESRNDFSLKAKQWEYLILAILLVFNLILKVVYISHEDYINPGDERLRVKYITLTNTSISEGDVEIKRLITNHPPLTLYILQLANRAFGGDVRLLRIPFLLLSSLGLYFMYLFMKELNLDRLTRMLAMVLFCSDQYFIHAGSLITERSFFSILPIMLYFFWRAQQRRKTMDMVLFGLVSAVAFLFKESALIMLAPICLYLLLMTDIKKLFQQKGLYLGLSVFLTLLISYIIWDSQHNWLNWDRHINKASNLGLSPRFLSLYLGELILPYFSSDELTLFMSNAIWNFHQMTSHWVSGLLYFCGVIYAVIYLREKRDIFLLIIFGFYAIFISVLASEETWNNFWWAAPTLIPAIIFAARLLTTTISSKRKLAIVVSACLLIYLTIHVGVFASQPSYKNYIKFLNEKNAFIMMFVYCNTNDKQNEMIPEAKRRWDINQADHLAKGVYGFCLYEEKKSDTGLILLRKALADDPQSLMLRHLLSIILEGREEYEELREIMEEGIRINPSVFLFHYKLGEAYLNLGLVEKAKTSFEKALELKPDDFRARSLYELIQFGKKYNLLDRSLRDKCQ